MQTVDLGKGIKIELHSENPFREDPAKIVVLHNNQPIATVIANSVLKQGHGDEAGHCVNFNVELA